QGPITRGRPPSHGFRQVRRRPGHRQVLFPFLRARRTCSLASYDPAPGEYPGAHPARPTMRPWLRTVAAVATFTLVPRLFAGAPAARPEAEEAVAKGLAVVQKAAANYPNHRTCFSCHHQTLPMLAMATARARGVRADEALLQEQADFTLESFQDKLAPMREG